MKLAFSRGGLRTETAMQKGRAIETLRVRRIPKRKTWCSPATTCGYGQHANRSKYR
jgi:hypothetical protein